MTVLTTAATTGPMQGNGATTSFNYAFIIPYLEDGITPAVNVWYTDLTGTKNLLAPNVYTISGVGNPAGGSVTFSINGTPIATGTFLTIDRAVPYTQPDSFPNQSFLPQSVEEMADNLEEQIQQLVGNVQPINVNSPVVLDFRYFGNGVVPTAPLLLGYKYAPFAVTILEWTIQCDPPGSMVVDIWAALRATDALPTVANSICGGNYPTVTSGSQRFSSSLTGWTVGISAGSAFGFNLRSISTITDFTISLTLGRTSTFVGVGSGSGGGGGGGGGGAPSGPAGGDLTGSYPNPDIAMGAVDSSKIADGSVANIDLANMAAGTIKSNLTGAPAAPSDNTLADVAAAMGTLTSATRGVPQQMIRFSLTGGTYALIDSFPAGAAGPTAVRNSTGLVTVTLGTTALKEGWAIGQASFVTADETIICGAPAGNMVASGAYQFNLQAASSKTYYDADTVLILFY